MEATGGQTAEEVVRAHALENVPFSLQLSDAQRDMRDWVHGFA